MKNLEGGRDYRLDEVEYRYELEAWEKKIAEEQAELEDDFKKAKKDREKDVAKAKKDGKEFKDKSYKEDKRPRARASTPRRPSGRASPRVSCLSWSRPTATPRSARSWTPPRASSASA